MERTEIDGVLAQADLLTLVEQAGGQLRRYGDGWRGACPLHGGTNETAFSIFTGDDGFYHWKCFADCDAGGDAIEFVKLWKGLDFKSAVEYLGGEHYNADPKELARIAQERAERAAKKLEQEIQRAKQALDDLRQAERHLYYHEHAANWMREEWNRRGLDESWQGFYYLGGCEDFVINDGYHTPTLTIPIFNADRQVLNIRHRLMKPQNPQDKYRPDRPGLRASPFLGLPELGYDGETVLVVEGEIKAAVTFSTIGGMDWQVIGVPGQVMYKHLFDDLNGKNVVVCPDPGAEEPALEFAKSIGGRYFTLPAKIDDWILEVEADKDDIYSLVKQARKA